MAIHGEIVPATVNVAQEHIVPAVPVEIPEAGKTPRHLVRKISGCGHAGDNCAVRERMVVPATIGMAEQHVIRLIAVEVAYAGEPPLRVVFQ